MTDTPSENENTFKPDPPQKVNLYQVAILFTYHVLLAIFLAYAIYNVWPPQPWPGDKATVDSRVQTKPSPTPNLTGANANANSAPANSNAAAPANANSAGANANNNSHANQSANVNRNTNSGPSNSISGTTTIENVDDPYKGQFPPAFKLFSWWFQPTLETRLILLVLLAGAIGSYVHAASSLVDYLGNRTMISSWVWWYLLRPFIGMMLALIFYFGFRGGFITAGVNPGGEGAASFINPFGIAAMAGLVGMFSKVAADKLNEVFLTLFRPASGQGDAKRGDKLAESVTPSIGSLGPNTGPASGGTAVTITGTGFVTGATVTFGGVASTAVVVNSATAITAIAPPHTAGAVSVEVMNPDKQKTTLEQGFTYTA
jgi:hypothetical protein